MKPVARAKRLLVEKVEGETLVYDLKRHRAHCLNDTAEFVWNHCDGENSVSDLARLAEEKLCVPASDELVWLALDHLDEAHLLERVDDGPNQPRVSRRAALRKLGRLSLALPLVASIAVPTPAQAATNITTKYCRDAPFAVGKCCTNGKICQQSGQQRRCDGAPC